MYGGVAYAEKCICAYANKIGHDAREVDVADDENVEMLEESQLLQADGRFAVRLRRLLQMTDAPHDREQIAPQQIRSSNVSTSLSIVYVSMLSSLSSIIILAMFANIYYTLHRPLQLHFRLSINYIYSYLRLCCSYMNLQRNDDDEDLLIAFREDMLDEGPTGADQRHRHEQHGAFQDV